MLKTKSALITPGTGKLRLSDFVKVFENNDMVALYHSISHQVIFCAADEYSIVRQKLKSKIVLSDEDIAQIKPLIDKSFIVPLEYNEFETVDKIRTTMMGKPSFDVMFLLLTDTCNMRCKYCFIENAMPEGRLFSMMSKETAINAINFFAKTLSRNPTPHDQPMILFYGGEPFLNKDIFKIAVSEISKRSQCGELPSGTQMLVITNGTLIDSEVVKLIKMNNVKVAVSLDGTKDVHDANRIYENGKGTFDNVVTGINQMLDAGIDVSISCTITETNINQLDEILLWIYDTFGIKTIGFNMLLDLPMKEQTDEKYVEKMTTKLIECFAIERKKGIYEDRIMRKVKPFVTGSLHLRDCDACGFQLVVAPDGKIGPCQGFLGSGTYFTGDVNNPKYDPFCDPTFLEWSKRSPFNMDSCQGCYAAGICGGGCAYNAWLKSGNIWEPDKRFCIVTKYILQWMIWELKTQQCSN